MPAVAAFQNGAVCESATYVGSEIAMGSQAMSAQLADPRKLRLVDASLSTHHSGAGEGGACIDGIAVCPNGGSMICHSKGGDVDPTLTVELQDLSSVSSVVVLTTCSAVSTRCEPFRTSV